jgi:tRNA 5-methylaminomethyl-2-thiouridine biosynthesis bifunctional protein
MAAAPQLVLASALDIPLFEQSSHLPVFRFRGQVSHVRPSSVSAPLRIVVCREGYATPAFQGVHCVGASFHRNDETALRMADHLANIERLERMLPGSALHADGNDPSGRVGFRPVSPDKVPIVGQLYRADAIPQGRDLSGIERWPGLHVATGYGARGAVWAPLMAELLAAQINGDPLPIESDLAASVDPARFLARTVRERQFQAS